MPAPKVDLYYMQDARNNFDAMRPTPLSADANQYMGQCQNIHISTNCYYGYHDPKTAENTTAHVTTDCEMFEAHANTVASPQPNSRKRIADDAELPLNKRFREEGMVPQTPTCNPCLLRPTHNNPDISRCLMVHMI